MQLPATPLLTPLLGGLVLSAWLGLSPQAAAAAGAAAPASASAASAPKRVPAPSPAAAAELAQQPGKLRPENPVVPQLVLPLRPERAASALPGGIDQRAARCAAQATPQERRRCRAQAAASQPAAPPPAR